MINEIIILILGVVAGAVILFAIQMICKSPTRTFPPIIPNLFYNKPMEVAVNESVANKAKWICNKGAEQLSGWREMPQINIKFCRGSTMPNNGRVSGVFYFGTPDTIYINSDIINQSWLVAKIVLHELYHLYQVNAYGTTNDSDETVNRWSDDVMDIILFSDYYKEHKFPEKVSTFKWPGKFTQIKNENCVGTIWSER